MIAIEALRALDRRQERRLQQVLRVDRVSAQVQGQPQQLRCGAIEQLGERCGIAAIAPAQEQSGRPIEHRPYWIAGPLALHGFTKIIPAGAGKAALRQQDLSLAFDLASQYARMRRTLLGISLILGLGLLLATTTGPQAPKHNPAWW